MGRDLNCFDHFLIFVSPVSTCVSISAFASLVLGVAVGITSLMLRLKICAVFAGIKKYNLIYKEKRKTHNKIVLLGKAKLATIKVMISKALIDSYISHDKFVSENNVLRE